MPLTSDDSELLKSLFNGKYISWHVEFGRIYNVDSSIVNILYEEIFINLKNISIATHSSKLNRYFNKLGFKAKFESLIKYDVINLDEIELVLIGGSADSSNKIIEIIKNITLKNITLVIVQHVESDRVGIFDTILQGYTNYKVSYARDLQKIQKNSIYIAPNNKHLKVENGFFSLSDDEKYNYSKPSISISYESFSAFYKNKLLVIQECGYVSDGVDKLEYLKENNSKLIIQDIDECEAKPMVKNALNINVHNYMFNVKDMITYINIIDNKVTKEVWIEYLLDKIYEIHNYDFRLYHRDMLNRRLNIFMIKHEIKNIKDAVAIILFNKSAFKGFFLEISINVTELFRHPKSLKYLEKILYENSKQMHNIKVWSAGCSSGEETYSVAILLDTLGLLDKSIIYATDFNSVVLEEAKNALYSKETYTLAKKNFSEMELNVNLCSYFIKNNNYVTINDKIKKKTLFFEHNLVEDSSFNEFNIIICRNVIIYFNDDLQQKVFQLFYESLKFGGYLVLGESEFVHSLFIDKFKRCSDNSKIFKKVA
ncbi:MAG: hypothetical protein K8R44_05665 [Sulfurimonas sp.]|nr:hypothetical protein [Sulfurimonas sp.]